MEKIIEALKTFAISCWIMLFICVLGMIWGDFSLWLKIMLTDWLFGCVFVVAVSFLEKIVDASKKYNPMLSTQLHDHLLNATCGKCGCELQGNIKYHLTKDGNGPKDH